MELKGIDYFPFSINFFEDNKIALLEAEFGSDGVVVILKLLSRIYRGGYYCHWEDDDCLLFARKAMDGMAAETVRAIVAKAVERGLFDRESFERHAILTSVEIQEQFFTVAARRKRVLSNGMDYLLIDLSKYKSVRVKEFPQPKAEMDAKSSDLPEQSKGKEKKGEYIYTAPPGTYFEDSSLNDAFLLFLKVRQNNGDSLTKEQVQLLREELLSMSDKPEELTAIVKKSAMNGWKSFYPLKKARTRKTEAKGSKNRFNNFPQREYDFEEYEKQLLKKSQEGQNRVNE